MLMSVNGPVKKRLCNSAIIIVKTSGRIGKIGRTPVYSTEYKIKIAPFNTPNPKVLNQEILSPNEEFRYCKREYSHIKYLLEQIG